jgi:TolA-binding protein
MPIHLIKRATADMSLPPPSWGTFLLCAFMLCSGLRSYAQPGPTPPADTLETSAFGVAVRSFQDGIYDRAERELEAFVHLYPGSGRASEAILLQAQALIKQQKLLGSVSLLNTNLGRAGTLADQYLFWLGESYRLSTNYDSAAETFARLIREYPNSVRLLESSYGEAQARFKLKDYGKAAELLKSPNGVFRTAVRKRANDELATRGELLLAEALYEKGDYAVAEQQLLALPEKDLLPEFKWWRLYHLCQVQMASRRLEEALKQSTNLLAFATAAGKRTVQTESIFLQGKILELLDRPEDAAKAYALNDADSVPPEVRKKAVMKSIELSLTQQRLGDASKKMEGFLKQYPEDNSSDGVLLALGELRLRQAISGAESNVINNLVSSTNLLQQALATFDRLLKSNSKSPQAGKAQLERGWCLWLDGKIPESIGAFKAATEQLSFSADLAEARFKLGDALFRQGDLTNALATYQQVVKDFGSVPRVKNHFLDQALYQMLRTAIDLDDLSAASAALKTLLEDYPESSLSGSSTLLLGQKLARAGQPSQARGLLSEFTKKFPDSELRPQAELAFARSYFQEGQWQPAIERYSDWVSQFTNSALRPQAEADRAWAYFRSGDETNALPLFTNFLARFPTNELAPQAKYWLGDYYFRHGDFVSAERQYQDFFQNPNWPVTPLTYQARMMAARAAFAREAYRDAGKYLQELINILPPDSKGLIEIEAEASFRLGDAFTQGFLYDPVKPLDSRFGEALNAFSHVKDKFPASRWALLAWGRIGDCHFQLAVQDPARYEQARAAYETVLKSPLADVTVRNRAEYALGMVLEKLAQSREGPEGTSLYKSAFERYYNIVNSVEAADPFWLKEAGLAAARMKEEQKEWESAINIYIRLSTLLPPLRPAMEKKMDKAREQMRVEKG